ncbi:HAD family hydrolase [Thermovorax subterraneus]|nr:HAD family hydrolase [Thermovorax subterraneus]
MKAILFDLDGTLLPLDTEEFIENYIKMLSCEMKALIPQDLFVKKLWESTYAMINNTDPGKTNKEVFWENFFEGIECERELILTKIEDFYKNRFPELKKVMKPNPISSIILKEAESIGLELVIATNPIFPEIAIRERLRWINAEKFGYKLITTYENMHFTKPRLEYYEEILSIIGKDPEECLMVGNDVEEDLVASKLGIKTFLVTDYMINRNGIEPKPDYAGSIEDLFHFIKNMGGEPH